MKKCYPMILLCCDYASDSSEHNTDYAEKFVPSPEIRAPY